MKTMDPHVALERIRTYYNVIYLESLSCTRYFRLEKEAYGINISTILPGAFQTEFVDLDAFEDRMSTQWNDLTQELREEFGENFFNQCESKLDY